MGKYKLCAVYTTGYSTIRPIDEEGHDAGDILTTYEDDGTVYYAIYENIGMKKSQIGTSGDITTKI